MAFIFNTPVIHSKRAELRPIMDHDAEGIFNLRSNSDNMKFTQMTPYQDIDRAKRFISAVKADVENGEVSFWVIYESESSSFIGTLCLWSYDPSDNSAEIGYELLPEAQGYGYMTELVPLVLSYAKDGLNLDRINAITHEDNQPSISLLNKLGFVKIGRVKELDPLSEEPENMILYRLSL